MEDAPATLSTSTQAIEEEALIHQRTVLARCVAC